MPTAPFLAPERDDALKLGRAKDGGTTVYVIPGFVATAAATMSVALNTDYYSAFYVSSPIVVDQLACEVTVGASGNLRMGLYRATPDWQPLGAPLADSGSIVISAAVKTYTPASPVYLSRGRYLSVVNMDTTSTLRTVRGSAGNTPIRDVLGSSTFVVEMLVSRTYAAFPTPGTAWNTVSGSSSPQGHPIFFRVSAP